MKFTYLDLGSPKEPGLYVTTTGQTVQLSSYWFDYWSASGFEGQIVCTNGLRDTVSDPEIWTIDTIIKEN